MRLITPGDSAPSSVIRYLLPHEAQVITVRRHPAVLMFPVGLVLGGLILAGVLSNTIAGSAGSVANLVWWLWLALLGWFVWKVAEWSVDYFVITNQRMLLTTGLITRKVAMMPLSKVTDMSFERSLNGRMLGYGTFVLESAGQDQALRTVPYLPYPEQLYLEVCEMIFPPKPPPTEEDQVNEELDNRLKELSVVDTVLESETDPVKLTRLNDRKDKVQARVRELHERLEQIAAEKEGTRRT
jgi:membrane protein YdbS with pleckstrin-like domain